MRCIFLVKGPYIYVAWVFSGFCDGWLEAKLLLMLAINDILINVQLLSPNCCRLLSENYGLFTRISRPLSRDLLKMLVGSRKHFLSVHCVSISHNYPVGYLKVGGVYDGANSVIIYY